MLQGYVLLKLIGGWVGIFNFEIFIGLLIRFFFVNMIVILRVGLSICN